MHIFSWASWFFATSVGMVNAAGVMEVDLVFPRNQTYAPMEYLPIIFAYQNPKVDQYLHSQISFNVRNYTDPTGNYGFPGGHNLDDGIPISLSDTDPYFQYDQYKGRGITEGTWAVVWSLTLRGCHPESLDNGTEGIPWDTSNIDYKMYSHTTFTVFTIKNGSQAVDLAAPPQENDCRPWSGIAFNVTNTGEKCATLATSRPTANACRVKIDSAAAASISASLDPSICTPPAGTTNLPAGCPPPRKSSAQGLIVGGVWLLAAALGAVGYLLV